MKHYLTAIGLTPLFCLSLLTRLPAHAQLKPGDTLGKENWQAAKGLIPDSILRRFEDGSYQGQIIAPPNAMSWGGQISDCLRS